MELHTVPGPANVMTGEDTDIGVSIKRISHPRL